MMKPKKAIERIEWHKKVYKAGVIHNSICNLLSISPKSLYRYLIDIRTMPVDKAIQMYKILGLSAYDLEIDLNLNYYDIDFEKSLTVKNLHE